MDNCDYTEVATEGEINFSAKKTVQWKPFLRQVLICSGGWVMMFLFGMCIGGPTVFIPQLRKEANSTDAITDDIASWLSSAYSLISIPFLIITPIIANLFGRKISFIIGAVDLLVGFIVLYYSSTITQIFISQLIHGLSGATTVLILVMVFTEYMSPTYRGVFLIIKTTSFYWGIWVSNAVGTFFHWKINPLIGIVCSLYAILIAILSPESPYWLANKGRFQECAISHRWLKGCDEDSEKELETLIESNKEFVAEEEINSNFFMNRIKYFWKTVKSEEFYKPCLISFTTISLTYFCGKLLFVVYALEILKQITNNDATAYAGMLILDGVTVVSMFVGCILARYLSRRTFLIVCSSIGAMFLYILSLYLYLIKLTIIGENMYASLVILTAFSVAVSCGPLSMGHSFFGELLPLRSRHLAICLVWLGIRVIDSTLLKTTPLFYKSLGLHGFFLFFGICTSIVILILYKYLPETQNMTLKEINDSIVSNKIK